MTLSIFLGKQTRKSNPYEVHTATLALTPSRPLQRIDGALFDYKLLNRYNVVAGYVMLFAQIIFVINCFFALFIRLKWGNINKSLRDYFK